MSSEVEIIARGVCCVAGHILLCHSKGADNTYLPGGHVDFGESSVESVRRELREELGIDASVESFLGVVEHQFIQSGEPHCEINLVFRFSGPDITPGVIPPSQEDHIEFLWASITALRACALAPEPLCERIPLWLETQTEMTRFASTFPTGSAFDAPV